MAMAIPAIVGFAATKAGTAMVAAGMFGAVSAEVGTWIAQGIGILAGFITSGLLATKPETPSFDLGPQTRQEIVRQTDAPREYVYGRQQKGGVLLFHYTSRDNQFFYAALALASHPIQEVELLQINDDFFYLGSDLQVDTSYTSTGITYYKPISTNKYYDNVWFDIQLGSTTNTVNSRFFQEIRSDGGDFKSTDVFSNISVLYFKLKCSDKLFGGLPNVFATIKGKNDILDTRTSTTGYTANPALCLYDYLTDTVIGLGALTTEIETAAVNTAANICDEDVTTKDNYIKETVIKMTAKTSGTVTISASYDDDICYRAFNSDLNLLWRLGNGSGWLQYYNSVAKKLNKYEITASIVQTEMSRTPKDWTFQASNTGLFTGEQVTLDTQTNQSWTCGETKSYTFANANSYNYYRLVITANNGTGLTEIALLDLYSMLTIEDRYTCNGVIVSTSKLGDIITALCGSMSGSLVYVNGKFRMLAGAYQVPTVTITNDDIIGDLTCSRGGKRDKFNAVKGVFLNEYEGWKPTDFPHVTNSTYEAEDGERIYKEVELPFTISNATAQRIAKIDLERNRQDLIVNCIVSLRKYNIAAGDTVAVTYAPWGWTSKVFDVIQRNFTIVGDGDNQVYAIALSLRETASTVYTWVAEETLIDPAPNTNLPNLTTVETITGLTLLSDETQLLIFNDGTLQTRILLTWTPITDIWVLNNGQIEAQYKKSTEINWSQSQYSEGSLPFAYIVGVTDGDSYDVRVRCVNAVNKRSDWTYSYNHIAIGKTSNPSDVTIFNVYQNSKVVNFIWQKISDLDVGGYEVRYGHEGTQWESLIPLIKALKAESASSAKVPPGEWIFHIRAIDTTDHYSTGSCIAMATVVNDNREVDALTGDTFDDTDTLTNCILHYNGTVIPEDQHLASYYGDELWSTMTPTPYSSFSVLSTELDGAFNDTLRAWGSTTAKLGPGHSGYSTGDFKLASREDGASDLLLTASTIESIPTTGTFTNCILHYNGTLIPIDQSTANTYGFELFDKMTPTPYASWVYEYPEYDLGADYSLRFSSSIIEQMGIGETVGTPNGIYQVEYKPDGGTYTNWATWSLRKIDARYIKQRITCNTDNGTTFISKWDLQFDPFEPWTVGDIYGRYFRGKWESDTTTGVSFMEKRNFVIDKPTVMQSDYNADMLAAPNTITFPIEYHFRPSVQATTTTANTWAVITAITTTNFTVSLYSGIGPCTGTIDWIALGI